MKPTIATSIVSMCMFCMIVTSSAFAKSLTPPLNDDSVKAQLVRD